MKQDYAYINDIPGGRSLAAIRKATREKLFCDTNESSTVKLESCHVMLEADTWRPVLIFNHDGHDYSFYLDRAWFKKAKKEFEGFSSILSMMKNRDSVGRKARPAMSHD